MGINKLIKHDSDIEKKLSKYIKLNDEKINELAQKNNELAQKDIEIIKLKQENEEKNKQIELLEKIIKQLNIKINIIVQHTSAVPDDPSKYTKIVVYNVSDIKRKIKTKKKVYNDPTLFVTRSKDLAIPDEYKCLEPVYVYNDFCGKSMDLFDKFIEDELCHKSYFKNQLYKTNIWLKNHGNIGNFIKDLKSFLEKYRSIVYDVQA